MSRYTLAVLAASLLLLQAMVALASPPQKLLYRYSLYERMGPIVPHGVITVEASGVITYKLVSFNENNAVYEYNVTVDKLNITGLPGGEETRRAFLEAFAGSASLVIDLKKCDTRVQARSREAGVMTGALPIYCEPDRLKRIAEELRNQSLLDVDFKETSGGYVLTASGERRTNTTVTRLALLVVYDHEGVLKKLRINITGNAGIGSMEMRVALDRLEVEVASSGPAAWVKRLDTRMLALVAGGIAAVVAALILLRRRGR